MAGFKRLEQPGPVVEQRMGVETARAVAGEDLVDQPEPVGAGDRVRTAVPDEQV